MFSRWRTRRARGGPAKDRACDGGDARDGDLARKGRVPEDLGRGVEISERIGGDNHHCFLRVAVVMMGTVVLMVGVILRRKGVGEKKFCEFTLPEGHNGL